MKAVPILCAFCLLGGDPWNSRTFAAEATNSTLVQVDAEKAKEWRDVWEKNVTGAAKDRYCDKAMGEDLGWLMSHLMNGFYHGYLATHDPKWVDLLVDWTDSWIKRGVKEPDGFIGWPKAAAAGTKVDDLDNYDADSLLGEAMALMPVVMTAGKIMETPSLAERYGGKAESYLRLAEQIYDKWDKRGAWRQAKGGGMISVTLPCGIDLKSGGWAEGFDQRNSPGHGFSHPNNKANLVASWLLAMSDVTHKPVYKERAEKWFELMKSRMSEKADGTYEIWNYWQPAGPWDYKPDGAAKHWVGVHPNAGYYSIDVEGIVAAYRHGLVFNKKDLDRLIATALATDRNWEALAPFSEIVRQKCEASLKPNSWGGITATPKFLILQASTQ